MNDLELEELKKEFNSATPEQQKTMQQETEEQLKHLAKLYIHQSKDELGILTVIAEQLGFKYFSGESMCYDEDVGHFISDKNELLDIIYNDNPDEETLQDIRGEE